MEDFIGNNAKVIVEWGQLITTAIIFICVFLLWRSVKKNKYFLPRGFWDYSIALVLTILIIISGLAFTKVTRIKPRVSFVLNELEMLQNKPAPPFEFYLLTDDSRKTIRDYKGKLVLLNYWATWCAPCIKEMPELNKLQSKYGDQGLIVIALSDEDKERLIKFSENKPFTVTAAYSKEFNWADIQTERPITFLIDREGVIVDYFTGGYDFDFFESKIRGHIQ
jgi:thiol-disulfide isomerase/thioredoxin